MRDEDDSVLSLVHFRFPTHVEVRYTDRVPKVGDVFAEASTSYRIKSVEDHDGRSTCWLEAVEKDWAEPDDARRDREAWNLPAPVPASEKQTLDEWPFSKIPDEGVGSTF